MKRSYALVGLTLTAVVFLAIGWINESCTLSSMGSFLLGVLFIEACTRSARDQEYAPPIDPYAATLGVSPVIPKHGRYDHGIMLFWGPPEMIREHFSVEVGHEYIALVANWHASGVVYAVSRPGRHAHVLWGMQQLGVVNYDIAQQGFLTSKGRFVTREEAIQVADLVHQIPEGQKAPPPNQLFSEDLFSSEFNY